MSWTLRLGSELGRDLSRPPMPKPEPEATLARDICLLSTCAMGAEVEDSPVNLIQVGEPQDPLPRKTERTEGQWSHDRRKR